MGGIVKSIFGGDDAADAAKDAAEIQAQAQQQALEYLKETERIPQQFREQALLGLGGLYGLEGGEGSQQELIDRAKMSPLYRAILGTGEAGEEAILRRAAATGGLRSGDVQSALYDHTQQLQNRALLESYNQQVQGLSGLAGLPSRAGEIAQYTAGIGQTLGQGQIAAAQAEQAGLGLGINTLLGVGQIAFSDRRLKEGVIKIGESGGLNIYAWQWNDEAADLGLTGDGFGVMADEVERILPNAVSEYQGYKVVDYGQIPTGEYHA